MTVIFSKKCEYGLQAVLYLSTFPKDEIVAADKIAAKLNIPKEFVSKILQSLTEFKLISSRKGKAGGFSLAKDTKDIKLIDVVNAIDGLNIFKTCVLGFPKCSCENPCPVHNEWGVLRDKAFQMLSTETIDKMTEVVNKKIMSI